MCRVISVSSLEKKTKRIVEALGGYGIVQFEKDEDQRRRDRELEEQETAWELFVEREPTMFIGGLW